MTTEPTDRWIEMDVAPAAVGGDAWLADDGDSTGDAPLYDRVVLRMLVQGTISRAEVRAAERVWSAAGADDTLWRTLAEQPGVDRDSVYAEAASVYSFPTISIAGIQIQKTVRLFFDDLPAKHQNQLRDRMIMPVETSFDPDRGSWRIVFATDDPTRPDIPHLIEGMGFQHFELRFARRAEIEGRFDELIPKQNEFLARIEEQQRDQAVELTSEFQGVESDRVDEEALEAEVNRSELINLFEAVLVEAVRQDASDIHISPDKDGHTAFKLRIDGDLRPWYVEEKVHPEAILAVAKDRAIGVDRFERDTAQDGFIQRRIDGTLIRYRVSVLPIASADQGIRGESIVIRVLDDRKVFTDLAQIGMLPLALQRFERAIRQPYGMVIVTGPTGSGKSTTLAAALHQVINPRVHVLTIEDPIEYMIPAIHQIKLGPRLNMQQALRSILRHDPDIVMVGEIRDQETAELAVKLANTGHLTFSTLHTNDAPSAVGRLYKMGIEPFLVAYAINLIVAQRLVRALCPHCKEVDPTPDTLMLEQLGFAAREIEGMTCYRAASKPDCPVCSGSGYRGRRAITEVLPFSTAIRQLILQAGGAIDENAVRDVAIREGMLTLRATSAEYVRNGVISVDEVLRATTME